MFLFQIKAELRDLSPEEVTSFIDDFNNTHIYQMVSSNDINENKGGVLAISKCINKMAVRLINLIPLLISK